MPSASYYGWVSTQRSQRDSREAEPRRGCLIAQVSPIPALQSPTKSGHLGRCSAVYASPIHYQSGWLIGLAAIPVDAILLELSAAQHPSVPLYFSIF